MAKLGSSKKLKVRETREEPTQHSTPLVVAAQSAVQVCVCVRSNDQNPRLYYGIVDFVDLRFLLTTTVFCLFCCETDDESTVASRSTIDACQHAGDDDAAAAAATTATTTAAWRVAVNLAASAHADDS